MISRCTACMGLKPPVAHRIVEVGSRAVRQSICGDCWHDHLLTNGWQKSNPQDAVENLIARQAIALDNLNQLECILERTVSNLKEEIAIRQMVECDRIADEVTRKYEPELAALREAISAVMRQVEAIARDVEEFAA